MKKLNFLLVLLSVSLLTITSCKKGDTGATGPAGATGANGAAGATGTPGADGSVIYSGTAAPDASKGVNGDFYINTSNGLLYGPKTAAGWGTGFSLKGPTGATGAAGTNGTNGTNGTDGTDGTNGKNGSQILSGTGAPAANLGATGDYYFDKGSALLYGPKIVSGWGAATNLKGNTGPVGPAGTANVIYSGWAYATNFRDTTVDNSALKAGDLLAPALTNTLLNSGTVMVYFNYGGGVLALPYVSYAGGKTNTISFMPRLGHFVITRFTADNSNSVALSTLLQYRYVIIPGGITATAAGHVDINNFESVRKYYRITN